MFAPFCQIIFFLSVKISNWDVLYLSVQKGGRVFRRVSTRIVLVVLGYSGWEFARSLFFILFKKFTKMI
jgi:hypothetical protein